MEFRVAPTERPPISDLGISSLETEEHGVDILWEGLGGKWGVQRKAVPDLIASVRDGRLGQELVQMGQLVQACVVVEGRTQWTRDGVLLGQYGSWTITQHRGVLCSIQQAGAWVLTSADASDTCSVVRQLAERSIREKPSSLLSGKGMSAKDEWGRTTGRSYAIRMMSTWPGVSVVLAARIFDHFGRVPVKWDVTETELREVEGIGKGKAGELMKLLEVVSHESDAL